jgi:predicted permease
MLIQNFRYAARSLHRARGFAAAAILSLALGIGVNVAIFSVINSVLIKPLGYPEPDRLVHLRVIVPKMRTPDGQSAAMSPRGGFVVQWRNELRSFESIGAATGTHMTVNGDGQAERVDAVMMTADFLDVLGAKPHLGRWFVRAEEQDGAPDVVILSHSLWRRRFSEDPQIIGKTVLLDSKPYQVVGITPTGMPFPEGERGVLTSSFPSVHPELFVPVHFSKRDLDVTYTRIDLPCTVVGRLKRGISMEAARGELDVSLAALTLVNRSRLEMHPHIESLHYALVSNPAAGDRRKGLLVISGAVGFLLLIVCANIANLTLVRATNRWRELAVRSALGAGRRDLISASLAESVLIALGGTILGLLLAWWVIDLLIAWAPASLPGLREAALDRNVLGFAVVLCGLTSILFGLLPAWRMSRISPLESLQATGRSHTAGRQGGRLRAGLVSAEVALSTLLLVGAGLLLASFQRVMHAPRGFESDNIIAVDLSVPQAKYVTFEQRVAFFDRVLEEVKTLPAVHRASYANGVPLASPSYAMPVILPGRENVPFYDTPFASWWHISGGYFAAMGIPLMAGRTFEEKEKGPVAVVSETAARRLWPGENPIGKKFLNPIDRIETNSFQVVGVVKDVREIRLDDAPNPMIYLPYWHTGVRLHSEALTLVARTTLGPAAIAAAIRDRVRKVDRDVAVPEVRTMTHLLSNSLTQRRFQTGLLAAFAGLALLLASIGIYGVVAYTVAQRRAEIGIRVTLGAQPRDIKTLMLGQGIRPVLIGLAIGLAAAGGLMRFMASLLFEVRPLDPFTFTIVPAILLSIAALACYLPARQAAAVDPMAVLRNE